MSFSQIACGAQAAHAPAGHAIDDIGQPSTK
jgi:hypothetical protein